ncbi:hypothetical protein GQ600_3284 [Phytophthora cactorum]|nr:hypothetical protein GQ600_3284 [Phytophthora cactorum]
MPCVPNATVPSNSERVGTNGDRLSGSKAAKPAMMIKATTTSLTIVTVFTKALPNRTPINSTTILRNWMRPPLRLADFRLSQWKLLSGYSSSSHSSTLSPQLRATPAPDTAYSRVSSHAATTAGSSPIVW